MMDYIFIVLYEFIAYSFSFPGSSSCVTKPRVGVCLSVHGHSDYFQLGDFKINSQ